MKILTWFSVAMQNGFYHVVQSYIEEITSPELGLRSGDLFWLMLAKRKDGVPGLSMAIQSRQTRR